MYKNKGFTLVELLAVIVVLGIILTIGIPNIINVINKARIDACIRQTDLIIDGTRKYVLQNEDNITWTNDVATIYLSDLQDKNILPNPLVNPMGGNFNNTISGVNVVVTRNGNNYSYVINNAVCQTSVVTPPDYVISEGVNKPKLVTGMTPIKWNGTTWIDTTEGDPDWYSYTTTDKMWANARTNDGSMWVWIPRYAYQTATNYHASTTGTINVKFLKGNTNTASDNITVTTTPSYSGNSQTNYILHPAFNFGGTALTGIWVAKFEASGTINGIDIKPNASTLRTVSIDSIFTASRNMETNNKYGWGITGTGFDTHLMKNTEWGAVAYISQSAYGKNSKIWSNNNSLNMTGCAGNSESAAEYAGCQYTYDTANGMQASTTGNIYGIYDIAGGNWEYVAAYVDNGHSNLTSNGNSIVNANSKYKDVYTVTTDNQSANYNNASNKKGDALYENSASYNSSGSWYVNYSYMPYSNTPWFMRGGAYNNGAGSGAFSFYFATGAAIGNTSFRVVIVPSD